MSYGPMRFGEPVFDGSKHEYPIWWVKVMPEDSAAFEQLVSLRIIYDRLKRVLGPEWINDVTIDWDFHMYHDELEMFTACWEKEPSLEKLKDRMQEINLVNASDFMRSLANEFDPMWKTSASDDEGSDDEKPTPVVNPRTMVEKVGALIEKESIIRDLDAFDEALEAPCVAKRARV